MSHLSLSRIQGIAFLGLGLALVAALALIIAGPGHRFGWWHFSVGFSLLRYGTYIGIAGVVVSALGLLAAGLKRHSRAFLPGIAGIIIGLVVVYVPYHWLQLARSVPPIHDISTDLENPPEYRVLVERRGEGENPIAYEGEAVAAQQREHYPHIQPLETDLDSATAFAKLRAAVEATNWEIAAVDPETMRIEATDRTFWFGFKDDIVLTVTPTASGSRIDMRSQSRVGRSDIGANARRIDQFMTALAEDMQGGGSGP